jgi:hypothetical protein
MELYFQYTSVQSGSFEPWKHNSKPNIRLLSVFVAFQTQNKLMRANGYFPRFTDNPQIGIVVSCF